jgi:hypothetical protein
MTLPPPDTHCWDEDTGKDVWSHSADQMRAYAEQAVAAERERWMAATALCDKHQPSGGTRGHCVICAGEALSAALSKISYLCGEPNEMGVGPYDLHCDENSVVEQVRTMRAHADQAAAATGPSARQLTQACG